ncbi:hypothetical protein, partial [Pseudohalocynthiibacter sp. F2068]|uniref:hypothetical protein n=1 Tax=Pseudohalocynthiibacter sp. F2068 TaxID=2926418 RepID=UPI001FF23EFB
MGRFTPRCSFRIPAIRALRSICEERMTAAPVWFQLIAATHASNFSAGVWYCKVFRGRSLS